MARDDAFLATVIDSDKHPGLLPAACGHSGDPYKREYRKIIKERKPAITAG
jgi:hypothetical protein